MNKWKTTIIEIRVIMSDWTKNMVKEKSYIDDKVFSRIYRAASISNVKTSLSTIVK